MNLNLKTKIFLKKGSKICIFNHQNLLEKFNNTHILYILDIFENRYLKVEKFLLKYLYTYFIVSLNLDPHVLKKNFLENINLYNDYSEIYLNFINNNLLNCKCVRNYFYRNGNDEFYILYYFKKNIEKLNILIPFIKDEPYFNIWKKIRIWSL